MVPAVAHFIGTGTTDAANTEARNVELAVTAYMAEYTLSDFDGDIGPGTELGPEVYLSHPSNLQAVYTIEDGVVVDAEKIDGSKWGDLEYNPATGWS